GQTACCWVVRARSNLFVSNTGSGTISSYSFDQDGALTLLNGAAANTGGAASAPIDMAVGFNGRNLFVLESGSHTVSAWTIARNGTLSSIGEFGMLPMGSQGIASR